MGFKVRKGCVRKDKEGGGKEWLLQEKFRDD